MASTENHLEDRLQEPAAAVRAPSSTPTRWTIPRLQQGPGFWAVAVAFFIVTAFSTVPSSLYGLYGQQENLSPLTLTFVYAIYAVGLITSLILVGHLSDWHGRRTLLLPAIATAIAAAVVFLVWRSLAGLIVARVLTGFALGGAVATATAFVTDLDGSPRGLPSRRAAIVATVANLGGLASGPLIAGLLARYAGHPLTLPFQVFLVLLVVALVAVAIAPDGHPGVYPRPRYAPQHLAIPAHARDQVIAALAGGFLCFGVFGLFAGLAGRFLAGPLQHPSPALCGLAIFVTFGAGIAVQVATIGMPAHRLIAAGIAPAILGLAVLVAAAWTTPPSLTLFLIGGVIAGAGGGAIFRGSTTVVINTAHPDERASALATFFTAGFAGLTVPVLGIGIALEHVSDRVALLIFGSAVAIGILAAAPRLVRPGARTP